MLSELKKLPVNSKVGVVGSGVAGLTFTYFLHKLRPDVNVKLFDAQQRTGGWIHSCNVDTLSGGSKVMLEKGPRTLRGVSDGTVLIIDSLMNLGGSDKIKCITKDSSANKKFILSPDDKLVQVPDSIGSFGKFCMSPLSKGFLTGIGFEWARKSKRDDVDESVESFVKRRYGSQAISDNLMSALYHGIYADDVSTLSAKRIMRKSYDDELKFGSFFKAYLRRSKMKKGLSECLKEYCHVFNKDTKELMELSNTLKKYPMIGLSKGLETFPNMIREEISKSSNVEIITDKRINRINRLKNNKIELKDKNGVIDTFDHVRVTLTPPKILELLPTSYKEIRNKLIEIESNTVILINFYLEDKNIIPKEYSSFGYLIPKSNKNDEKVLGVIFDSVIEQNFQPLFADNGDKLLSKRDYTKMTVMLGGHLLNDVDGKAQIPEDPQKVIERVKDALQRHIKNITREDLNRGLWQYTVAEDCLPRFNVGYDALAQEIEREVLTRFHGNVSLGGMGFSTGPGIPDVIVDGFKDSVELSQK
ncbi:hypothetical protein KAFR_0G02770 [Kazachstania africana CBS 2517]|uniref:Protoporphyrinogen oxidase n=1 Tax=Kazachstania africana (strain ATCC 22294 / BCRC 22015 / CBS 2517 / CECT 1963 / NBRC 1671 / NRRL Y-8276) TaxID=1071382 RepID=H2AY58_KAZAF|nr:hypothetical protein KAFR_0G02770 [Kazachstania africana CBS 2517]CCF59308.1 hypothetical protein KAFR_0G02770 [Kazachstania africana CBS 2517]